jgi:ABC-2 type transport system ATP-binding protein
MWPELTGWENLLFLGSLNKRISKADIRTTLERVGLDPTNPLPIKKYSLGMRQRLIVAQAIMEKPNFLFLDEPTNAIDKEGVLLIRDIIAEEANRGAVVLLASHISQDISTLCTEIYHMKHGRIEE